MNRRWRTPLGILILLLIVPAPAGAQDQGPPGSASSPIIIVASDEVWTTPRSTTGQVDVQGNATLRVVGTEVRLSYLHVGANATLILESTDEASTRIAAADARGWGGALEGNITIRGAPDRPVVFDGIKGQAAGQENRLFFEGGLYHVGRFDADGLLVRNYTSGIYVNNFGSFYANRTRFESLGGVGLLGGRGDMHVKDAEFFGPGAGVYVGTLSRIWMENASFQGADKPIVSSGQGMDLRDVRVTGGSTCLTIFSSDVVVDGFTCTGFNTAGIRALRPPGQYNPSLTLRNATISTTVRGPDGAAGVFAERLSRVQVSDSTLGPIPDTGMFVRGDLPILENVTFQDIGGYAVTYGGALNDSAAFVSTLQGSGGRLGWLEVREFVPIEVFTVDRFPAIAAKVDVYGTQSDATLLSLRTDDGGKTAGSFATLVVVPNRTAIQPSYRFAAQNANATESTVMEGVHPTSAGVTIYLEDKAPPLPPPDRKVPVGGWTILAGLLAAACLGVLRHGNPHRRGRQ